MTSWAQLVIVSGWDFDAMAAVLDEAIGSVDPEDPKGRKRLRILETAAELFAKDGYRKTNIDDIARASGIAKGTVYLYFKNKGAIAYSAIALEKKRNLEQIRPAFDPTIPARERLRRFVETALLMASNMPVVWRLLSDPRDGAAMMHDMPAGALERASAMGMEAYGGLLQEAGSGGLSPETLRERVQALQAIGALARLVADPQARGEFSPRRYARVLADVLVAGLLHREPGESK
jgi:AcrR family transcriptional regulator